MRVEFALRVGQAALGGGDASSQVNDLPLAIYFSRLHCNGSQVVDLEFESGIASSCGEHGLDDTPERRVQ